MAKFLEVYRPMRPGVRLLTARTVLNNEQIKNAPVAAVPGDSGEILLTPIPTSERMLVLVSAIITFDHVLPYTFSADDVFMIIAAQREGAQSPPLLKLAELNNVEQILNTSTRRDVYLPAVPGSFVKKAADNSVYPYPYPTEFTRGKPLVFSVWNGNAQDDESVAFGGGDPRNRWIFNLVYVDLPGD